MNFEEVSKLAEVETIVEGYYDGTLDGDEAFTQLKDLGYNVREIDELLEDRRIRIYGPGLSREPLFYLKDGDRLRVNGDLYDVHFIDSTHFEMTDVDFGHHSNVYHVREWQERVQKFNIKQEAVRA
ncbi:MAG: hypothetical protein LBV58_02240 [Acholeplasmatales bacterium]|jgi:hypothetical protein|nr:hypothetical protein [Acholeplasmatales bacterium]